MLKRKPSHQIQSPSQSDTESGFTLVELLIVAAVTGFIVLAATGIMVTFTKIKYVADVQTQLKSEATFAANQIDLMIRNSSGIPDLCVSEYISNGESKYCNGTYQQTFTSVNDGIECPIDSNLDYCWGNSTTHCIYKINDTSPEDRFDTYTTTPYRSLDGITNPLYMKSYRELLPNSTHNKHYLIVQTLRQDPSYVTHAAYNSQPASTFFGSGTSRNQDTRSIYYNQVITLRKESHDGNEKLSVLEFKVGDNIKDSGRDYDTSDPFTLLRDFVPNRVVGSTSLNTFTNAKVKQLYLTSDSVRVSDLSFDCTLHNYGLPNQGAAIKYTIEVAIPKEGMNEQYDNTYEKYALTRFVSVRNGSQPFRFTQHSY